MANRVYLSTNGLKISAPGFNAMTATGEQLTFSSDKGGAAALLDGTFTTPASGGIERTGTVTVLFGKSFGTYPPLVYTNVETVCPINWNAGLVFGSNMFIEANIQDDRIIYTYNVQVGAPAQVVRYRVFDLKVA